MIRRTEKAMWILLMMRHDGSYRKILDSISVCIAILWIYVESSSIHFEFVSVTLRMATARFAAST